MEGSLVHAAYPHVLDGVGLYRVRLLELAQVVILEGRGRGGDRWESVESHTHTHTHTRADPPLPITRVTHPNHPTLTQPSTVARGRS